MIGCLERNGAGVASAVAAAVVAAIIYHPPRTVVPLDPPPAIGTVSLPLPAPVVIPRARPALDPSARDRPALDGPLGEGPSLVAPLSVSNLSSAFRRLGYDLDLIVAGYRPVPRIFFASFPADIDSVREPSTRKTLFVQTMLPLILRVNERILEDRRRLWDLRYRLLMGRLIGSADRRWLEAIADRYDIKGGDIDALIDRVDVVPPSLALAQAAEESGWGTSRFVREGNAIFGQWTLVEAAGIEPLEREDGKTHRIRVFDDLLGSVEAYVFNLNTHRAYHAFRRMRARMRLQGVPLDSLALARTLTRYSERGRDYVRTLHQIIGSNRFDELDSVRLPDPATRFDPSA